MVKVDGYDLWFTNQGDAMAFNDHRRKASIYRNRLAHMVGASDLEVVGR